MTTQTEAQRLAALISRYRSPHCGEAAAVLLRQDELLGQALEALDALIYNKPFDGRFGDVLTAIRAHREAK